MRYVLAFVLLAIASVDTAVAADPPSAPAPIAQKAVLVTGASTGIGRKITERLAKEGYFIYAGARKEQDLKDLNAIPNVQAVRLDVTSADDNRRGRRHGRACGPWLVCARQQRGRGSRRPAGRDERGGFPFRDERESLRPISGSPGHSARSSLPRRDGSRPSDPFRASSRAATRGRTA